MQEVGIVTESQRPNGRWLVLFHEPFILKEGCMSDREALIERLLAENGEFRKLREQSLKFGRKSGLLTDEDVFKAIS